MGVKPSALLPTPAAMPKHTRLVPPAVAFAPLLADGGGSTNVTGRDHHPFAFSVWAAGGGIKGGQVIGGTDDIGWNVVEDPIHVNDPHATVLHLFGLARLKLTYKFQGRDFRLTDVGGTVVKKLLQ